MSNIKVIEGLEPGEVMRAAKEGKKVAVLDPGKGWQRQDLQYISIAKVLAGFVAIIDDSQPVIDWEDKKWNWGFFNQYGGLPVVDSDGCYGFSVSPLESNSYQLRESPYYSWFGGKQPVPDNVEVRVVFRGYGYKNTGEPKNYVWEHGDSHQQDIIAFRLTGRVL